MSDTLKMQRRIELLEQQIDMDKSQIADHESRYAMQQELLERFQSQLALVTDTRNAAQREATRQTERRRVAEAHVVDMMVEREHIAILVTQFLNSEHVSAEEDAAIEGFRAWLKTR